MPMEVATINVYILSGVVIPGPLLLLEKGILSLRMDWESGGVTIFR